MLGDLYDIIGSAVLVCGGIGAILGINSGIINTRRRNTVPSIEKYTVEIEFTDPMLVLEIQTLKQLQEVYNAQIVQQNDKLNILNNKYTSVIQQIQQQYDDMEYTSHIGDTEINKHLYKVKIAELSESKNELMGQVLRIEEKILKITKQSNGITAKLDKIALDEYKRQNQ